LAENIQNTPDIRTELVKSYGVQAYAYHPLLAQGHALGTLSYYFQIDDSQKDANMRQYNSKYNSRSTTTIERLRT
jgi:hypothetical protein